MNEKREEQLWAKYRHGKLTPEDDNALHQALSNDSQLRDELLADAELDGMMRGLGRIDATADRFVEKVVNQLGIEARGTSSRITISTDDISHAVNKQPVAPPPVQRPTPVSTEQHRSQRARSRSREHLIMCASAAGLVMIGLVGVVILVSMSGGRRRPIAEPERPRGNQVKPDRLLPKPERWLDSTHKPPHMAVVPPVEEPETPNVTATIVPAQLVSTNNAVWVSDPPRQLNSEPMELHEGKADFLMGGGTYVTLEGPAKFQLESPDSIGLSRGRMFARVGAGADFLVKTPSSELVDRGGEFDVQVENDGATGVCCQRGELQLAALADGEERVQTWNLREGDYKLLQRDGTSHDMNLAMDLDKSGRGSVTINGDSIAVKGPEDFANAWQQMNHEFARFESRFVKGFDDTSRGPFSGIMDLGGERVRFTDVAEFETARRRTTDRLNGLSKLFGGNISISDEGMRVGDIKIGRDGIDIGGLLKVNDREMKFGNLQDLMRVSQELKRSLTSSPVRTPRETPSTPKSTVPKGTVPKSETPSAPGDKVAGSITIDGKEYKFKSLEELAKIQEDLRRRKSETTEDPPSEKGPSIARSTRSRPGPLEIWIDGASVDVVLRTTDREPETGTRNVHGAGVEVPVYVGRNQKVKVYIRGAGNKVYIPMSIKSNVETQQKGAGTDVRFYADVGGVGGRRTSGPEPITILVEGSSHDIYLKTSDKPVEGGVRKINRSSGDTTIYVAKDQLVTVFLDGSSNDLYVPFPLKGNVVAHINGSSCDVEYYTERTRFRDRVRPTDPAGGSTAKESTATSPADRPHTSASILKDLRPSERKRGTQTAAAPARDEERMQTGPLLLRLKGHTQKVRLEVTDEQVESGVRFFEGIRDQATVFVGKKQKVMLMMDGIGNEAVAPLTLRRNITTRMSGFDHKLSFVDKDGRVVSVTESRRSEKNRQQTQQQAPNQKLPSVKPLADDPNSLVVLVEGWKNDVIIRQSSVRGDYGIKIVKGHKNEITYNVRRDQHVIVCNDRCSASCSFKKVCGTESLVK